MFPFAKEQGKTTFKPPWNPLEGYGTDQSVQLLYQIDRSNNGMGKLENIMSSFASQESKHTAREKERRKGTDTKSLDRQSTWTQRTYFSFWTKKQQSINVLPFSLPLFSRLETSTLFVGTKLESASCSDTDKHHPSSERRALETELFKKNKSEERRRCKRKKIPIGNRGADPMRQSFYGFPNTIYKLVPEDAQTREGWMQRVIIRRKEKNKKKEKSLGEHRRKERGPRTNERERERASPTENDHGGYIHTYLKAKRQTGIYNEPNCMERCIKKMMALDDDRSPPGLLSWYELSFHFLFFLSPFPFWGRSCYY